MKIKLKEQQQTEESSEEAVKALEAIPAVAPSDGYVEGYRKRGSVFMVLTDDDGKTPTVKFSDPSKCSSIDLVKDFDSVGMLIPDGWTVMDFDNADDALTILKIIDECELRTIVFRTRRGIHLWFRTIDRVDTVFSHTRLACGLMGDRKIGGKNCYDKIKHNGKFRDCIRACDPSEVEPLPAFLLPAPDPSNTFPFRGMGEGSRNETLYSYIPYLQQKGLTHDEVIETIMVINRYVLAEPLDDMEIGTICRDEAFLSDEEVQSKIEKYENTPTVDGMEWFGTDKEGNPVFLHELFGDNLIDLYHVIELHGTKYIYADGFYTDDDRVIEKKMIEIYHHIKASQRTEVLKYIEIEAHVPKDSIKEDPYVINCQNGRLNVKTGELMPFTPDAIDFQRLPVTYDPDAYSKEVDDFLDRVLCRDDELRRHLEEACGTMLIKNTFFQKAVMLTGEGSNGKSTFLDFLKEFLGERNYSTIGLEHLGETFITAELENELANIGDDISSKTLTETDVIKKTITGNSMTVQHKGQDPYTLKPYATHFYSANRVPRSMDKSEGFYRRWTIIPFNATFTAEDPDFDPMILEKITTDEAKSYFLNLILAGAQRLMERRHFDEPEASKSAIEEYRINNSNVLSWIEDQDLKPEHFFDKPREYYYEEFKDWCTQSGVSSRMMTGKKNFYTEIRTHFNFNDKQSRADGKRYFCPEVKI